MNSLSLRNVVAIALVGALLPPALTRAASIPPVVLSKQHQEMCRVMVGDPLPAMALKTPAGGEQALRPLFGKRATVLVFFQNEGWMTRTLLKDLGPDIAKPFSERGITTVAVSVGRTPVVKKGYVTLVDSKGEAFAKIGRGKLPRVYVADGRGKIVWFDIEYSRSTRRELLQVLNALTTEVE